MPPIKMRRVPTVPEPLLQSEPPQPISVPPLVPDSQPENSEQDEQNRILIICGVVMAMVILALLLLAIIGCPPKGGSGDGGSGRGGHGGDATGAADGNGNNGTGTGTEQNAAATDGGNSGNNGQNDALQNDGTATAEQPAADVGQPQPDGDAAQDEDAANDTESEADVPSETPQETIDVDVGEGMNLRKGGKTSISLFGGTGSGNKFTFIFDRSGSMTGHQMETSKKQLIMALQSLKSHNEFSIVFFDHLPEMYSGGMQKAIPINISKASSYVDGISTRGGTEHIPALQMGIKLRPDCIFFLTDGEFVGDEKQQLVDIKQHAKGIQINVIQLGDNQKEPSPDSFLRQLAQQNNGDYKYIWVRTL